MWLGGLLVLAAAFRAGTVGLVGAGGSVWATLGYLAGSAGLLTPFVVFAGGVAVAGASPRRGNGPALIALLALAVSGYVLQAYAEPVFKDRGRVENPGAAELPFTPRTPGAIIANRRAVLENPPAAYTRSIDQPLTRPPNLLTHWLHFPVVLAVFALLNGILGFLAAQLTGGLSPPARRNARWALGLFGGIAFFVALVAGDSWVASSLDASGVGGAWLPLAVPLMEGGILIALLQQRSHVDHEPTGTP